MARNPAQLRGEIQSGITGDKRAGFDPAAAPLETDAEAAGTPLGDEHLAPQARTASPGHAADAYANAMESTGPLRKSRSPTPYLLCMLAFVAVIVTGALVAALWR